MVIERAGLRLVPDTIRVGRMLGAVGLVVSADVEGSLPDQLAIDEILDEFPGISWMTPASDHGALAAMFGGRVMVVGSTEITTLSSIQWATWPIVRVPASWIGVPSSGMERSLEVGGMPSPVEIHLEADAARGAGITPRFLEELWSMLAWTEAPVGTVIVSGDVDDRLRARIVSAALQARVPWLVQSSR